MLCISSIMKATKMVLIRLEREGPLLFVFNTECLCAIKGWQDICRTVIIQGWGCFFMMRVSFYIFVLLSDLTKSWIIWFCQQIVLFIISTSQQLCVPLKLYSYKIHNKQEDLAVSKHHLPSFHLTGELKPKRHYNATGYPY